MTDVSRETRERLDRLTALVLDENTRQNLISARTASEIADRHIDDSIQLNDYVVGGILVDIGTGAGFPGLVLACLRSDPTILVEPRARRADFLRRAIESLALRTAIVRQSRIETLTDITASAITARAVGSLGMLFGAASHIADEKTRWVLPKGRSAQSELDTARMTWQGRFELVPSRTDPNSAIVLASGVRRRNTT